MMLRTELMFGLSKPDGTMVAESAWRSFLDSCITPRFPDGLTIIETRGQYRMSSGAIVSEPSRLVVILHPDADSVGASLDTIRARYCRAFSQESVIRASTPVDIRW